ncbi:unnamed protein product [Discosporangium mesarthrocarpum]
MKPKYTLAAGLVVISCAPHTGAFLPSTSFAGGAGAAYHRQQRKGPSGVMRPSCRLLANGRLCMASSDAHASAADPSSQNGDASPAVASPAPPKVTGGTETIIKDETNIRKEWELDVYSRPVVGSDGKKLWELLMCDSTGNFRHVEPIPSNMVNSREVRKVIEGVIELVPGGSRPTVIRFFRNAMFNMIDIALRDVDVAVKPCRTTYSMYQWLQEREKDVYPNMEGYKPSMAQPAFFDIRTPSPLPDALRGEQYAFVSLPISEFRKGNINEENIGVGRLCPLDPSLPDDAMIPGLAIFTLRCGPLATWMTGLEVAFFKANLKSRELVLECGINTQYLVARVLGEQRTEAQGFEESKVKLGGLHFVSVQKEPDSEDVAGFWLLKEVNG